MKLHCCICTRSATFDDDVDAEGAGWDLGETEDGWHTCPLCQSPKHRRVSHEEWRRQREACSANARE